MRPSSKNADPSTVGGLGVSSGGHLIMLSAMRPYNARYTALPLAGGGGVDATLAYFITCWGVLDPYGRYLMAQERGNTDLMANHDRYFLTVEAQKEANPFVILQRAEKVELPAALLIQGTADTGVPPGDDRRGRVALRRGRRGRRAGAVPGHAARHRRLAGAPGRPNGRAHEALHRPAPDAAGNGELSEAYKPVEAKR